MNNKVVYTLYQIFPQRGFACMRFNFRGVGRSQGSFARGEGECQTPLRRSTGCKVTTKTRRNVGSLASRSEPGLVCNC